MKKILISSLFLAHSLFSVGQGNSGFVSFEVPDTVLTIDTIPGNLWQIGKPQKNFFDTAYSGLKAIVTDTINSYPINNSSSFIIKLVGNWLPGYVGLYISFKHKYDSDTLKDGCVFEYSDNKIDWYNLGNDLAPWATYNMYTYQDTLFNGSLGFSGRSDGWINTTAATCLSFSSDNWVDTLFIRFTFISDSIQNNKDGWLIDDISWGDVVCEGINNLTQNDFILYPNPATNKIKISNLSPEENQIKIFNLLGQQVKSLSVTNEQNHTINISDLPSGIYMLTVSNNKKISCKKFVKE